MKFSETRPPAKTGADYLCKPAGAIISEAFQIGFLFGRMPARKKKAKRVKAEDAANKYNVRLGDRYQACLRRDFVEARKQKSVAESLRKLKNQGEIA